MLVDVALTAIVDGILAVHLLKLGALDPDAIQSGRVAVDKNVADAGLVN